MAYGRRNKGHRIFSIFCGFTANNVHCNAALAQKTLLLYLSGQYGFQVSNMVCARGEDQNPLHVGWIVSLYILYLNYVIVLC